MGLGVFASSNVDAQSAKTKLDKQRQVENDYTRPARPNIKKSDKKNRAGSRWYDLLDATLIYRNGDTTGLDNNTNSTFLWIDSTMRVRYTGSTGTYLGGIYLKSHGQILDPFAKRFNDHTKVPDYIGEMALRPTDGYTVDSVAVAGYYRRIKQNITDTMIISVAYGSLGTGSNITGGFWASGDLITCYATDTFRQAFIDYNWATSGILQGASGGNVITKKVILSNTDTGGKYIATNIGLTVPAGNIVSMTYTFKSGDTWVPNVDTVADFNFFRAYYTEEVAGELALYEKGDYNSCQSIENDTTGWGITYVPNYLYIGATGCSKTFTREQYWTLWKLSAATNGTVGTIDQLVKGIEANVYPNPAANEATFTMNLTETANNVTIEIANTLGQVIKVANVGTVSANTEKNVVVNIADLAAGMYVYTINADGKKTSNKLMVK
jgi:hypothetical protein